MADTDEEAQPNPTDPAVDEQTKNATAALDSDKANAAEEKAEKMREPIEVPDAPPQSVDELKEMLEGLQTEIGNVRSDFSKLQQSMSVMVDNGATVQDVVPPEQIPALVPEPVGELDLSMGQDFPD